MVRAGRVAVDGVTAQAADGKYDPAARFEVDGGNGFPGAAGLPDAPQAGGAGVRDGGPPASPPCWSCCPSICAGGALSRRDGWTRTRRACSCSPMTAPWPTACGPRPSTWTRPTSSGWDGELDGADAGGLCRRDDAGRRVACLPAGLEVLEQPDTALVTLHEGKYHQIKRMLAARGKPVVYLKRLTMGPLMLDPVLERGEWRPLSAEEVAALRQA